jgi:hypothetical protein
MAAWSRIRCADQAEALDVENGVGDCRQFCSNRMYCRPLLLVLIDHGKLRMAPIVPQMAEAILKMLATIDGTSDQHPDWIEAVCAAREALPAGTTEALEAIASQPSNGQ